MSAVSQVTAQTPPIPFRRAGGRQVKEHFLPKVVPSLQLKVAGYTWYWSGTPQSTGSHVTCLFHFPSMQVMVTLDSVWKKTHGYSHHASKGEIKTISSLITIVLAHKLSTAMFGPYHCHLDSSYQTHQGS